MPKAARTHEILLVDDHPVMTDGLAFLLQREPDMKVCATATSIEQAWCELQLHRPDLIVSDLTLPDGNGLDFVKELGRKRPEIPVLIISMHDEVLYAERSLRAGARGYLMKGSESAAVVPAIRQVLSGSLYFSQGVLDRLVSASLGGSREQQSTPLASLTDRQLQVFELIGMGRSTSEIARQLDLSTGTIDAHRWEIRKRLNLRTNSELVRYAVAWFEQ